MADVLAAVVASAIVLVSLLGVPLLVLDGCAPRLRAAHERRLDRVRRDRGAPLRLAPAWAWLLPRTTPTKENP